MRGRHSLPRCLAAPVSESHSAAAPNGPLVRQGLGLIWFFDCLHELGGVAVLLRLDRGMRRPRDLRGREPRARCAGGRGEVAEVFRKAGFTRVRCAAETPFNLILEVRP